MAARKTKRAGRAGGKTVKRGRYTQPGGRHARLTGQYLGRQIAVAVLDQEAFTMTGELFPTSFKWQDPDAYLQDLEQLAETIAGGGGEAFYAFIDPYEYVEWCRQRDLPVDSQHSRAAHAQELLTQGEAVPYSPDQPLWPIGVTAIVLRSQLASCLSVADTKPHLQELLHDYSSYITARPGRYRCIVTASRYVAHNETELWQHFAAAVKGLATLTFCDDYISVNTSIENRDGIVYVQNYGTHDPFETVTNLAGVGHGIIGIESRHGQDLNFRAFEITGDGYHPMPVDTLGRRLGAPGAPSLRHGWDDT